MVLIGQRKPKFMKAWGLIKLDAPGPDLPSPWDSMIHSSLLHLLHMAYVTYGSPPLTQSVQVKLIDIIK